MKLAFIPRSTLGKWSVGLNAFFLIAVTTSIVLAVILKILNFDDHWWNVTAGIAFPASIIAFFAGIIAVRKNEERSILVILSILIGLFTILFILFHSLFISD